MGELNYKQNKAVDIVGRLQDMDYDFTELFIPLCYNFQGVSDYIISNYSEALKDEKSVTDILNEFYDICDDFNFIELNECEEGVEVEYVGADVLWYDFDDFVEKYETKDKWTAEYDKFAIPQLRKVEEHGAKLWSALQDLNKEYNIFKKYNPPSIIGYVRVDFEFTDEFKEAYKDEYS